MFFIRYNVTLLVFTIKPGYQSNNGCEDNYEMTGWINTIPPTPTLLTYLAMLYN
jgi:hypothetical protein